MKLNIHTEAPANGAAFGPGEVVRGCVDLHVGKVERVPDVTLVFQGIMKLCLAQKPAVNTFSQVPDRACRHTKSYTLFSRSTAVTPTVRKATDNGPVHTVPFAFTFPTLAYCPTSKETNPANPFPLPPSLRFTAAGLDARVSYSITATVQRRSRRFLLPRHLCTKQIVEYSPGLSARARAIMQPDDEEPPALTPSTTSESHADTTADAAAEPVSNTPHRASLVSSATLVPCTSWGNNKAGMGFDPMATLVPGCLPPYSPAMALELVMPQPPVVAPGGNVALGVFLRTPKALLEVDGTNSPVCLRSIRVRLRRDTVARFAVGSTVSEAAPTYWPLWSSEGTLPIRKQRLDLTAVTCGGVWASQSQVPEAAGPSFQTRYFSQIYKIEVQVEVSGASLSSKTSNTRCIQASMEVDVADPPPMYSEQRYERPSYEEICP